MNFTFLKALRLEPHHRIVSSHTHGTRRHSYPSAEMQSAFSSATADSAEETGVGKPAKIALHTEIFIRAIHLKFFLRIKQLQADWPLNNDFVGSACALRVIF